MTEAEFDEMVKEMNEKNCIGCTTAHCGICDGPKPDADAEEVFF